MQILLWVVPLLLLIYFLKQMGPRAKTQPMLSGFLAGGTILFYVGMFLVRFNPGIGSTIQLLGACVFFSGVALNITKKSPAQDDPQD